MVAALYAGRAIALSNYRPLLMAAVLIISICMGLAIGKRGHIFMAIATSMTGGIGVLPLPFSYQELIIFGCFLITLAHLAFKKMQLEPRSCPLDWILYLNIAYLGTVYMRNPAGFNVLGSDIVGARPYLVVIVSILFSWRSRNTKSPRTWPPSFL